MKNIYFNTIAFTDCIISSRAQPAYEAINRSYAHEAIFMVRCHNHINCTANRVAIRLLPSTTLRISSL